MKKTGILFILLAICSGTFSQTVEEKIKRFEQNVYHWDKTKQRTLSLKQLMEFYGANAISIAMVKDYKIEWAKAYGYADVSEKRTATVNTLFQAASISKSINSLGVLKLSEEGKINLDTDINQYLKSWQFPYDSLSKDKKITVAQLLNHTAGLSTHGFGGYTITTPLPTIIQILNGTAPANSGAVRSLFEPGLKSKYSGGGTTITQLIIEDMTKQKYENYMQQQVLSPLNMTASSYTQPPVKTTAYPLATGYYRHDKEVDGKYHIYPEKGAAGLWTNPTDLSKYIIETQLSLTGKSNKILSTTTSLKRIDDNLGVFVLNFEGAKYFMHNGQNEGFTCVYIGSVEGGDGLVIMTNSNDGRILNDIACGLIGLNQWKSFPLEVSRKPVNMAIRKESLKSIDQGIALYYELKKKYPNDYNFENESELNNFGYELMNEGKLEAALKIFDVNVREFPASANVYDSRGEAYFKLKKYELSKKDYQKALELDPTTATAKEMLLKIEALLK
jgi:CubicO group peptidase (beta-lactamase class C family)